MPEVAESGSTPSTEPGAEDSVFHPEKLRRGLRLIWTWNAQGLGASYREIAPRGRLVTVADLPMPDGCDLGMQIDGHPHLVLDPQIILAEGGAFRILEDAPIPKVLNAHRCGKSRAGAIYIGRPGPWGNPFSIGKDGTREEVLSRYLEWLRENADFVFRARRDLAGKDLICWCDPHPCHGHILRDLALGLKLPDPQPVRQLRFF